VALSRQFSNLGPAAKWNFHEGESGIVPGAVIATRSYGQGATPGGKMAKDMPDKKSHYHTGIALTYPDKDGNVLVYDQWKGHGATISKRNIRDYNGEKWGAVVGGEPSDKSREAVNLALGQASESQKAAIHAAMTGQSTNLGSVEHSSPVKEDAEADSAPSGKQLDQDGNVIQNVTVNGPTTIVQQAPAAPPPQPTAEVKKVEPAVTRFNFNKEAFLNEVGTKHPMAYSFVGPGREGVWSQTVQGLRDAEAKGVVKFNEKTGELVVNDMKHPEVQKILKDMKDNDLDRNTFMKQVEEKKAQAAPTPKAPPETKPASPAAQQTPATVKTEPAKEPPKVPGAATGGSFNVPDGGFRMEPLAINKGDNMAAVSNKTGQPLFTANSNEAMRYDPYNKRVDVSPTHKTDGNMRPSGSNVQDEMDALRNEMRDNLMGSGQPAPPQAIKISQSPPTSSTFTDDLTKSIARNPYNNPAFERAMMRTRMQEHGDPLNNHYSSDNTNW
jgi:hypothetical protein